MALSCAALNPTHVLSDKISQKSPCLSLKSFSTACTHGSYSTAYTHGNCRMLFQDPKCAQASILKAAAAFSSSRRGCPLKCSTRTERGDSGEVSLSTQTPEWKRAEDIVKEVEGQCSTPISRLREVVDAMAEEMRKGLASETGKNLLKMVISYVDTLPTG